VDQSIQRMGLEAVRMLVSLIRGEAATPLRVTLPTELVVRHSCSPPRAERPRRRARSAAA
jgi:Transcriptional regulators